VRDNQEKEEGEARIEGIRNKVKIVKIDVELKEIVRGNEASRVELSMGGLKTRVEDMNLDRVLLEGRNPEVIQKRGWKS
jgi:hypothetical protein